LLSFHTCAPAHPLTRVFLGHYGIAFAAKRAAPRTSLGATFFAAQFLDELWPILLLAGIERVRIVPGLMAANVLDFEWYPYSHSLVAALLWGVLIGLAYFALRRYGRGAWIVGACVVSHWFLDVPMHRPDLPLWPGSRVLVGFGMWNSVPLTLVVELALFAFGLGIYLRDTRARDRIGSGGLWAMVVLLAAFFLGGTFGGAPPSVQSLATGALGLWLFVPWAWWVDGHRVRVVG
jgi:hypothetical protein